MEENIPKIYPDLSEDYIRPIIEEEIIPVFKTHYTNSVQPSNGQRPAASAPVKPNFNDNKIELFISEKKKLDERLIHYKKIKIDGLMQIQVLKLLVFL